MSTPVLPVEGSPREGGDAASGSPACALDTPGVNTGGIGEASPPATPLDLLPSILDAARRAVVHATIPTDSTDDPIELTEILYHVHQLRDVLAEFDREWSDWLGRWTLEAWGRQKWGDIAGRVVERQWRSGRTTWDHSEVTDALLDYLDAGPQERSTVREVLNAAGVSYWRAGVLKERGIQPADFKAQDPGRWAINFPESS